MNHDEFLCIRCARHQKTCCQGTEIYTTLGDVERITDHTSQTDFYEFRRPDDPIYGEQEDDPLWKKCVFRADGTRRILKHQPNGDCTFLGEQGCKLPMEVRPLICRLYPFDYTETGILQHRMATGCPVELLKPGQSLLAALDMQISDAERWHSQLYKEIQYEPADVNGQTSAIATPAS